MSKKKPMEAKGVEVNIFMGLLLVLVVKTLCSKACGSSLLCSGLLWHCGIEPAFAKGQRTHN